VERALPPLHGSGRASSVAVSPDGSQVFVAGGLQSPSPSATATVDYAASTGAIVWAAKYTGGEAVAVAVSPSGGSVFVTGYTGSYTTLAYSVSG
jgi:DNA-binding beta-propeller fold protein YncE